MRLLRRQAGVDVVEVGRKVRLRLRLRDGRVEAVNKGLDVRRKRRGGECGAAGVAVVLEDPERRTVRIRGEKGVLVRGAVDLRARTAVDVDDREPWLERGELASTENTGKDCELLRW